MPKRQAREQRGFAAWIAALLIAAVSPADAAIHLVDNGVLVLSADDTAPGVGLFTIRTGFAHPQPRYSVLYPIGTSYLTLRDATAGEVWANADETVNTAIEPFVARSMQSAPAIVAFASIAGGFRTVYTLPNWRVTQDVVLVGTTLADTSVRLTVTVANTSAVARAYGLRTLVDWEVADQEESWFRPRAPDRAFTQLFAAYDAPAFAAFELVDRVVGASYSVFGSAGGGPAAPSPTPPERIAYVQWADFYEAPWDREVAGSMDDAATVHYWGYAAPRVMPPGGTASFHQYFAVHPAALGLPATDAPADVPSLSAASATLLAALLALAGARAARRRGTR